MSALVSTMIRVNNKKDSTRSRVSSQLQSLSLLPSLMIPACFNCSGSGLADNLLCKKAVSTFNLPGFAAAEAAVGVGVGVAEDMMKIVVAEWR